jgi:adenylosuccinate synthase
MTTVSRKVRRVGRFDWDLARRAVAVNRPTLIVTNGIDYIDWKNAYLQDSEQLSERARFFLTRFESEVRRPVNICGTGPKLCDFAIQRYSHLYDREEMNAQLLG